MVEFASALVMVLVGALINGFMVCWLLRSVTLSNEPAFAAFCFTIAAALGSSERISRHDPGGSIAAVGGLVGGGLGLWLFWRLAVRPERAGQGEGH